MHNFYLIYKLLHITISIKNKNSFLKQQIKEKSKHSITYSWHLADIMYK